MEQQKYIIDTLKTLLNHIGVAINDIVVEKGIKKVQNWLYVKHPSGALGYVPAHELVFKNSEYTTLLKNYYEQTPLLKADWKPEITFVKVIAPVINVKKGN